MLDSFTRYLLYMENLYHGCARFRPFSDGGVFLVAVESCYSIDIIGKGSLFSLPFRTRLPESVIKTKAGEL